MLTDKDLDSLLMGTGVQRYPREYFSDRLKEFLTDPSMPSLLLIIGLVKMIGIGVFICCFVNL